MGRSRLAEPHQSGSPNRSDLKGFFRGNYKWTTRKEKPYTKPSKKPKLFKARTASECWSDNIVEGSRGIKTKLQWRHFYAWLANPDGYNEEDVVAPMEGLTAAVIEPYPQGMLEQRYENGTETIIHVKNTELYTNEQEEEKVPE